LLADKAYDSNEILQFLAFRKIEASILPSANRKIQREYHSEIYRKRHRIENAFLRLKQWHAIATRYAKNIRSFLAAFHILCIMLALSNCNI
jgi:transposase